MSSAVQDEIFLEENKTSLDFFKKSFSSYVVLRRQLRKLFFQENKRIFLEMLYGAVSPVVNN